MRLCYCILGFTAHSIISGGDSDCDYPSNVDLYDYLGCSMDFEECADKYLD